MWHVGEILAVKPNDFIPDRTIVWDNIKLEEMELEGKQVEVVRIKIRSPKEIKSQHSIQFAELVGTGGWMCPVAAVKALKQMRSRKEGRLGPLCRRKEGSLLTGRILNQYLKKFLAAKADYLGGKLSLHSFRALV